MSNCILVMGVSGCGKTTIGKQLAVKLNIPFLEGDDYHPEANVSKMKSGQSLNDDDRLPWLKNLAKAAQENESTGFVMACSALKGSYRNILKSLVNNELQIVFLDGNFETIKNRMEARAGHFMPAALLQSQFDTLEKPETNLQFDIGQAPDFIIKTILEKLKKEQLADIGIIGLGVMGKSLARNFASRNIPTAVYNVPFKGEENVVNDFVQKFPESNFLFGNDLSDFIKKIKTPRCVLLMIKSGEPVDEMIEKLLPHLEKEDMIIDAGNSLFKDSIRRFDYLKNKEIEFVGMGVSGGEEGALKGPSIMPAGSASAKNRLLPMLQKIAAIADEKPCVQWIGNDGAGHFVKMVHNGIEYADMQLLTEVYAIGKNILKFSNPQIADELEQWKSTLHNSYLLDITIDILRFEENGESLLEQILDVAGHKGTGLWTVKEALDLGVPIPTIGAAMDERILSSKKELRGKISKQLISNNTKESQREATSPLERGAPIGTGCVTPDTDNTPRLLSQPPLSRGDAPQLGGIKDLFLFARLIALAEGLDLIKTAAKKYDWKIDIAQVAQLWRGGCIIRSDMLKLVIEAFEKEPNAPHLFATKVFNDFIKEHPGNIAETFGEVSKAAVPIPALSAAMNYYKSLKINYLAINLIQAQRDYFGAHTYKRLDNKEQSFHTNWKK